MTSQHTAVDLAPLQRETGGFAMLAVDQREALRLMFAGDAAPQPDGSISNEILERVPDATLTDFKLETARVLTPHASAVLIDRQFAFDAAVDAGVVAPGCGLIATADRFISGNGEVVTDVVIDEEVDPQRVAEQGAVAMKLLVIYRPDQPAQARVEMVERFVARCRSAGLISIIEPLSRGPRDGRTWDWNTGVHAVALELGSLGADLYKAEVPLHGQGPDAAVLTECAALTESIASPWVVLSSGVAPDEFPRAVELACRAGASGFLAGRAVWRNCVGVDRRELPARLAEDAVARLQRLASVVDRVLTK